jgi:hypothetical protein
MVELIMISIYTILFGFQMFFAIPIKDPVSVETYLINPANAKEISVGVSVKNISTKSALVLKNRKQDYKKEKLKAFGNYIIEIQKFEIDKFLLFEPTADINPGFDPEVYIKFLPGKTIVDTLTIPGSSFSRGKPQEGFPKGQYRLKISFNFDRWSDSKKYSSQWVEFKIE